MCGRYVSFTELAEIERIFGVAPHFMLTPSYNIAPTEIVPVVVAPLGKERAIVDMRWGLIPHWRKSVDDTKALVNAREETLLAKPSFRTAIERRRCILPAAGYYEWKRNGKLKIPYFIHDPKKPLFFAGIWEKWQNDNHKVISCAIITRAAVAKISALHDRMPLLLQEKDIDTWLNVEKYKWRDMRETLLAYSYNQLEAYQVSTLVNNARFKGSACIEPVIQ